MAMPQPQNPINKTSIDYDKIPKTLEEQKEYYLTLFQKWEKWKTNKEIKVKNQKMWELLQEVDFNTLNQLLFKGFEINSEIKLPELFLSLDLDSIYLKFGNLDQDLQFLYLDYFTDPQIEAINKLLDNIEFKKIIILQILGDAHSIPKSGLTLRDSNGHLNLVNLENIKFEINFSNCNFSSITLENFDRGYFSPETNAYLNKMEEEGKLTLINCTWSGLPVLREENLLESLGKKIWEKEIEIEDKFQNIKQILHQYLALFSDFVESTEGKKIQLRITTAKTFILIEVYSFNGATTKLIEKKFQEFALMSGEDEWKNALKFITSMGHTIEDPFLSYSLASKKMAMDYMIKAQTESNKTIRDLANIFSKNIPKPAEIFISQSQNNQQDVNQINNQNTEVSTELNLILKSITELKVEILDSLNVPATEKEEALEYIQEIVTNIKLSDPSTTDRKRLKSAMRSLLSIAGQFGLGLATNAAWESLKSYLSTKYGIIF